MTLDDDLIRREAAAFALRDYLASVIQLLPPDVVDTRRAIDIYRSKEHERQFTNEFVSEIDGALSLVANSPHDIIDPRPTGFVFFWNNWLWPIYTLTLYWKSAGEPITKRAFFMVDSPELDLFLKKPTHVVLLRNRKCVSAIDLNFPAVDLKIWDHLDRSAPFEYLGDGPAAKLFVEKGLNHTPSLAQKLEFGWAKKLESEARRVIKFLREPEFRQEFEKEREAVMETPFAGITERKNPLQEVFADYVNLFWTKNLNPMRLIVMIDESLRASELHHDFILMAMKCAWFSSLGTSKGRRICSIDLDGTVTPVALEPDDLGDAVEKFWQNFLFEWPFHYELLVGPHSIPLDPSLLIKNFPIYEGEPEKGEEFFCDLLAEAVALKQWTIPTGAYVLLDLGEIKAVKLYEVGPEVACVLINEAGEYLIAWVDPSQTRFSLAGILGISETAGAAGHGMDTVSRVLLGIKILLAAIIRDFWVVEQRETVFGSAIRGKKIPKLSEDKAKPTIVYLPRVHYVRDIHNAEEILNFAVRRPHFVVGHLRKALHAGENQVQLARRYGIHVPEGFTFVRPHRRGDKAEERIYKSRSALKCISALNFEAALSGGRDEWFMYEINVKIWLSANGFETDHIAGSRDGDGGVDIQASREDEHLLVQCKYWRKQKVGPKTIREMLGTLQTFPNGSKGVIVTCAELTRGAKDLAVEKGIQFIERANFGVGIDLKL